MHGRSRIVFLVPAVFAALGIMLFHAPAGRSAPLAVGLVEREFLFDPKDVSVATGEVAFIVKNQGAIEHNLALGVPGGKTVSLIPVIEPGQTMRVTVLLPPGTYTIFCSLPGHKEAGMSAALRVSQ